MTSSAEETLIEATARLAREGYRDTFVPEDGGIRSLESGRHCTPSEVVVEQVRRFEGVSDPDDEAILLALHIPSDGARGTLALPFGPSADPESAALLAALRPGRPR